jgi:hypothetical protein
MDDYLKYKLREFTTRINYRKAAIKRHQEQLISGELRTSLISITESNIRRMKDEIRQLEAQIKHKIKQYGKLESDL